MTSNSFTILGLLAAISSFIVQPASLSTLAKWAALPLLWKAASPMWGVAVLSVTVLPTVCHPVDTLFAGGLILTTPRVLGLDLQGTINAGVLQVFAVYAGMTERGEESGGYVLLFGLLAGLGWYVTGFEDSVVRLETTLSDSFDEIENLKSSLQSLTALSKLHRFDRSRFSFQRLSALSLKLKHIATPRSPGKLSASSSFRSEHSDPRLITDESVMLTLGSEEGKCDSSAELTSNDLSSDDLDTLVTAILSKEFVLFGKAKAQKNAPIKNDFLQMLVQKNRVTLKNTGKPFKSQSSRKLLISTMEENSELNEQFEKLGEWNFDIFGLLNYTKSPLREVAFYIFSALNVTQQFALERTTLLTFLDKVERTYRPDNFYHNSLHAADVLNSVYFLLYSGVHRCGSFLELEIFTLITAALAHDVGHPGVNNAFLVLTQDKLAKTYNDHSVLENMHASTLFAILKGKQCCITSALTPDDYQVFRKLAISLILATDLQRHFDKQSEFKSALDRGLNLDDVEFRLMTLEICLKCADIGHGAKELRLHKQWSTFITKEFFSQGDKERALGLPISPLCNKEAVNVPKSQIGFIEVFVKPMFDMWSELVRKTVREDEEELVIEECLRWVRENVEFWNQECEAIKNGSPTFVLDDAPPLLTTRLGLYSRTDNKK